MTNPTSDRQPDANPRSTAALIIAATRDASAQFADLLRLARIEVRGNLLAVATPAGLFGGALLLVLISLVLLLIALRDAIAVLFHRVIGGHSFTWMASQNMGDSERLGVLFLAAIDATARHFGLRERSRAVEAMEQQVSAA